MLSQFYLKTVFHGIFLYLLVNAGFLFTLTYFVKSHLFKTPGLLAWKFSPQNDRKFEQQTFFKGSKVDDALSISLTRNVFLPVILNLSQIFAGVKN